MTRFTPTRMARWWLVSTAVVVSGCGGSSSTPALYMIGGKIAGLTQSGLTLTNGASSTSPAAHAASFMFPVTLPTGSAYSVAVKTQPAGEVCSVSNGTGTVSTTDVASVQVTCALVAGLWTWVGGSAGGDAAGVFGTRGVAVAGNMPGARSGAAFWTDAAGNFWLFGGGGYGAAGSTGNLNDLWMFNPSSGLWTWVSGSETPNAPGVYGMQAVAASSNTPGARTVAAFWTDRAGNLWLFGGQSMTIDPACGCAESLNDLWRFDPSTGFWTWVGGSNTPGALGVYGKQGVAAAGNVPGARAYAAFSTDSSGDLWLFSGGNKAFASLNDLWKFSPSTGLWTWVSGSSGSAANPAGGPYGVYGTQGVAAAGNVPGGRGNAALWTDSSGKLWLFGGIGWGQESGPCEGDLSDSWEYSPSTGLWTWVSGSNTANAGGACTNQNPTTPGNQPSARNSTAYWTDKSGKLWLFGGQSLSGFLNDLWNYDPSTGIWTWETGAANTPGASAVYGNQGVPAPDNTPGARSGAAAWLDGSGNTWLFGGSGSGTELNDLWERAN